LDQYPNAPVIFKDTLFVDFLGLPQKHSENKLKNGLIEHMKQFILELGKDFIFMDQEYTLNVGSSTYKADLLFFHRGLQALVAVELKKTKFHPRDLGQLEFYLEALDRDVKRSNENPSIGIILCPDSDHVVVEYAMSRSMSPTMVAEYKRILIPQERMQEQLNEFCQFFIKDGQEKSF
jgi:RecB family endonuclease NucS